MTPNLEDQVTAGEIAFLEGRLDDAEKICLKVLESDPHEGETLLILCGVYKFKGLPEKAKECLRDPGFKVHAFVGLSEKFRKKGDFAKAKEFALEALEIGLERPSTLFQVAICNLDLKNFKDAEVSFRTVLASSPDDAKSLYGLGKALQGQGKNKDALAEFKRATALAPNEQVLLELGGAYMIEAKPEEAGKCALQALQFDPNSWAAHLLMARALIEQGSSSEAMEHAREALRLRPEDGLVIAAYGKLMRNLGQIDDAQEQFKRAIEADPDRGHLYFSFVNNHKVTEEDRPLVEQMERLTQSKQPSLQERTHLEYGLGKAHEDLGEFEQAMAHFEKANRLARTLKFGEAPFDPETLKRNTSFIAQYFSRPLMETYRGLGNSSEVPIFVVGMMRSGTTLTEQILSSHPTVGGAGEVRFWSEKANAAISEKDRAINVSALNRLSVEYLDQIVKLAPNKAHVVDKMPANYSVAGLLHLAFPKAKIVHVMRNPVDTCLSIYVTPNRNRVAWAHDKNNIALAYKEYLKVMAHWRTALPEGVMFELQYEELVSKQEETTKRLAQFCGLEWDEAFLHPESNDRSVFTPSVWQVRQPVYKTSMDRWKRYEPWLGAFRTLTSTEEPSKRAAPKEEKPNAAWLYRRAEALVQLHRPFEAIEPLHKAIDLQPDPNYMLRLADMELDHGDPEECLALTERAQKLDPNDPSCQVWAARSLLELGRNAEAGERWNRGYEIAPPEHRHRMRILQAKFLVRYGEFEQAIQLLDQVLKQDPKSIPAYCQLASAKRVTEDDRALIEKMEWLLADRNIRPEERLGLRYSLGKLSDDLGDYKNAFAHFDAAHKIELDNIKAKGGFSHAGYASNMAIRREVCSREALQKLSERGNPSEQPIFVVGMIRSGTTLAEQILASHPQVSGAGELSHWINADLRLIDYPNGRLYEATIRDVADIYLKLLERFAKGAGRVVDKQPGNLILAGVLHAAFPNARIVYMRRNSVDTAVSIWNTRITTTVPFVHEKGSIVFATQEHDRLRQHWQDTLPSDRYLEVSYEDLVRDREATTRNLLAFCGLPWDEACMFPERTQKFVTTPSLWQVRQPVYDRSIGRWKNYEPWLGELRRLLPT